MKIRPMTDKQRRALHLAARKGGALIVHARTTTDKAAVVNAMANTLQRRGWATRAGDLLLITKEGRVELNAPIPEDAPVYLHQRDGLTTRRDQGVRDEGEVIDPATLQSFWREEADRKKSEAEDRRAEARKLRDRVRAA